MTEGVGVAVIGAGMAGRSRPSLASGTAARSSSAIRPGGSWMRYQDWTGCPRQASFADGLCTLQVQRAVIEAATTGSTAEVTL